MAAYTKTAQQKKEERQYEINSAVSTLQRAEQIKRDRSLMMEVKKQVQQMSLAVGATKTTPKKKK